MKKKVSVNVPAKYDAVKAVVDTALHITLGLFISADGAYFTPLLVFPLIEFPSNALPQVKLDFGVKYCHV